MPDSASSMNVLQSLRRPAMGVTRSGPLATEIGRTGRRQPSTAADGEEVAPAEEESRAATAARTFRIRFRLPRRTKEVAGRRDDRKTARRRRKHSLTLTSDSETPAAVQVEDGVSMTRLTTKAADVFGTAAGAAGSEVETTVLMSRAKRQLTDDRR